MNKLNLILLPTNFAICRLAPNEPIPNWASKGSVFSITKTDEELSIVCEEKYVPENVQSQKNWRCLKIAGPLDFSLTGILLQIAQPLAAEKISIFAISTFDTDYILVKATQIEQAGATLEKVGHKLQRL